MDGESAVSARKFPINFSVSQSTKKDCICHFDMCPLVQKSAAADNEKPCGRYYINCFNKNDL